MLEIYNEKIRDLFGIKSSAKLDEQPDEFLSLRSGPVAARPECVCARACVCASGYMLL